VQVWTSIMALLANHDPPAASSPTPAVADWLPSSCVLIGGKTCVLCADWSIALCRRWIHGLKGLSGV